MTRILDAAERLRLAAAGAHRALSARSLSRNLIARFGSASAALEEVPAAGTTRRRQEFRPAAEERCSAANWRAWQSWAAASIAACEPDFPLGLAALDPPPPLISVLGQTHLLQKDMVAIVGARNASALARKFAQMLARDLGEAGLVVVSGLARGIDSAAHEAGAGAWHGRGGGGRRGHHLSARE